MNVLIIDGRLTDTPEEKTTANGKIFTKFTVANSDGWGENKETYFIDCMAFGHTGETINKHMGKGDAINVSGKLTYAEKEKDGVKKRYYTMMVDKFNFPVHDTKKKDEDPDDDFPF